MVNQRWYRQLLPRSTVLTDNTLKTYTFKDTIQRPISGAFSTLGISPSYTVRAISWTRLVALEMTS